MRVPGHEDEPEGDGGGDHEQPEGLELGPSHEGLLQPPVETDCERVPRQGPDPETRQHQGGDEAQVQQHLTLGVLVVPAE